MKSSIFAAIFAAILSLFGVHQTTAPAPRLAPPPFKAAYSERAASLAAAALPISAAPNGIQPSQSASTSPQRVHATTNALPIAVETTLSASVLAAAATPQVNSSDFVTHAELNAQVQGLENSLRQLTYANLSTPGSLPASGGYTNTIALTNRIDQLTNTTITTPIINNPTVTGGSISGSSVSATNLSASGDTSLSGNLSVSGNLSAGVLSFSAASSTGLFAQDATITAATTTSLFSTLANFTNAIAATFNASVANIVGLTATSATTTNLIATNATTTNLAVSGTGYFSHNVGFGTTTPNSLISINKVIAGSSTLGEPSTSYLYTDSAYPVVGSLYNSSGWNQSTSGNGGRTSAVFSRLHGVQDGQGDFVLYNGQVMVNNPNPIPGVTSVLANPAGSIINGDVGAGANGVYLNSLEFALNDYGYDVAAAGPVINLYRTNSTGANGAFWYGTRIQSGGSQPIDTMFSGVGPSKFGLDLSYGNFSSNGQAAIALSANQRIYLNTTPTDPGGGNARYPQLTADYCGYSTTIMGFLCMIGNNSTLQVTSNQLTANGTLAAVGSSNLGTGSANYIRLQGAASAADPVISLQGSDTNISGDFRTKGAGSWNFLSDNGTQFQIGSGGSNTVNHAAVLGSPSGSPIQFLAEGSDSNINLNFVPKGAGNTVFTTGNIGIGQTSPTYKLDVNGNGHFTSFVDAANFFATSSSATSLFNGNITVNGNTTLSGITSSLLKTNAQGQLVAAVAGTDYQVPLSFTYPLVNTSNTISEAWGTTTVNTWGQLQTFTSGFISNASSTEVGNFGITGNDTINGSDTIGTNLAVNGTSGTSTIASGQGFTIGVSQFLVQQGSGNIGIGTASPTSPLHILNSSGLGTTVGNISELENISGNDGNPNTTYLKVRLYRTASGSGWTSTAMRLQSGVDSSNQGYIDFNPGLSSQGLSFGNAGSEYMRIASTGNIGIGTTNPYSRLQVTGPDTASTTAFLVANSASTTEFAVYDTGNATLAGGLIQNSDQRLKTNIQSLDASSSLSLIDQLNPVTFNWIDPNKGPTPQLGFIAQQVLPIFPNLVATTSPTALTPDGTLALNYIDLISPIVSAIQALSSDIMSIENTITGFATIFHTQELCVGSTCVTPAQFQAMVAAANASQDEESSNSPSNDDSASSTPNTPPVIQINGDNPAIVQIGATYSDLGATITGPQTDLNLGVRTFLNGTLTSNIVIDTSAVATDTIDYVATDQNGLASTSTRTVIIEAATSSPSI